jgi:hypothetical protein
MNQFRKETINMSKRDRSMKETRRRFLKGLAVVGGGALAVVSRPGVTVAPEATEKPTTVAPKGYRVTAHILDYYEKARL